MVALDSLINQLPAGCARSLHGVFEGVHSFGQGPKTIVSRLCTLKNGTLKHESARKVQ